MKRKALLAPTSLSMSAAAAANSAPDGVNAFQLQARSTPTGRRDETNSANEIGMGNTSRLRLTAHSNQTAVLGLGGGGMNDVISGMDANKVGCATKYIQVSFSVPLRLLGNRIDQGTDALLWIRGRSSGPLFVKVSTALMLAVGKHKHSSHADRVVKAPIPLFGCIPHNALRKSRYVDVHQ
jgi:hypothetical protein